MKQLSKVNQDIDLLRESYKNKAQQNQVLFAKAVQQNQASATEAKTQTKPQVQVQLR